MTLANDVRVIADHAGFLGGRAEMHQIHERPGEVIIDHVGFGCQLAKLLEDAVGKARRGQLKIHPGLMNLMFADLQHAWRRIVAQRQHRALDTVTGAAFAHLEDDLFDATHGVGQIGFIKVQNSHINLP